MTFRDRSVSWYEYVIVLFAIAIVYPDEIVRWLSVRTGRALGWMHLVLVEVVALALFAVFIVALMPVYPRLSWWLPVCMVGFLVVVRIVLAGLSSLFRLDDYPTKNQVIEQEVLNAKTSDNSVFKKTLEKLSIIFVLLMGFALSSVFALVIYTVYGVLLWFVASQFLEAPIDTYTSVGLLAASFIAATAAAIKKNLPSVERLSWDSGSISDAPSKVSYREYGGRLWNVNPLGPNSIRSISTLVSGGLCFPQALFIAILKSCLIELKKSKEKCDPIV